MIDNLINNGVKAYLKDWGNYDLSQRICHVIHSAALVFNKSYHKHFKSWKIHQQTAKEKENLEKF